MERNEKPVGKSDAEPQQLLSVTDGVFLMIGMVIGVGIFKAPSVVAGNSASALEFFGAWILGGIASLCGALVYAELASRHPHTGGEYTFLSRAFGQGTGFLFAWSRLTVIQTGAIAAVAFVFGDYASEILNLGERSSAIYAAFGIVALTALNIASTLQSKTLQKVMEIALISGLLMLAIGGLAMGEGARPVAPVDPAKLNFGLAMIFVLLTYGGWNEAAYLSGEVKDSRRSMTRILVIGIVAVTALYLFVNLAYYVALGLDGMKASKAPAADVMRLVAGERGAVLLAVIVCVSAATTMNAAIFTGARTNYALGHDFPLLAKLGTWKRSGSTPANALLVQCVITLVLVLVSSFTPDGFSAMVAYTSPVFWTFFLLTGVTLFFFRARGGEQPAFKVPLYPVVPLVFLAMCGYMLYSSINYIRFVVSFGNAVLAGTVVMAVGIPLYFLAPEEMTLTELRYIVAVAREKHFGRAASACFVSQPTLSVAIKKLEEELGVLLFERGSGEVSVTPPGRQVVEQAQRVLEEAARIKEIAQAGRDPLAGALRVGAIYTIGPYLFPKLVPIVRRNAPAMQLIIHENYTHVLGTMLKHGEVDAIVTALPFAEHGVETQPLYDEPFMVAMPRGHPMEKRKSIPADELAKESLLLLGAGHCFRDQVLDLCASVHRSASGLQRTLEGGSLETIRQMVASGVGVTVLPSSSVSAGASGLIRVRPFSKPVPQRRVALSWRKSFPRPQAIAALRKAILACELAQIARLD